ATAGAAVDWSVHRTPGRLSRGDGCEPSPSAATADAGDAGVHEDAPAPGVIDPSAKRKKRSKGWARRYGRFLIEELKSYIDKQYRTKPEAEFTGLGGSSLGALLTLSLGLWFPNVFTRLIAISPSVWWDDQVIVKMVNELDGKLPLKICLDPGTNEPG